MYNRYVPQADGSYRRNRMQEQRQSQPTKTPPEPQPEACHAPEKTRNEEKHHGQNVGGFFKQLLPPNFDTADLIIICLLLLLAGDCEEDKTTAMLTLVLYLFM